VNKDYQQLRRVFEGNDSFMIQGHQIAGLRRRRRSVPEWTRNNKEIKKILLRSFPKLQVNAKQRAQAACWARVIYLYFVLQWTYTQVASEIAIPPGKAWNVINRIKRAAAGKRANNQGDRSVRSSGRPKKRDLLKTT
jgi:hypothetical protein